MSILRYVALALCAALLAFATSSSSAQRRTAIRIPAGETAQPAAAPRKSEKGRLKQSRGSDAVPISRKPQAPRGYTPVSSDTETVGTPSYGELGIEKTSAEVMNDQAIADMSPHKKPRVGKGILRKEKIDRSKLPQDPNAKAVASTPALRTPVRGLKGVSSVDAPSPNAPQTVSTPNFTGATLADTGAFPPDTMGAVGPTQFVVFLNGRVRTFNKTTGVADGVVNADSDVFFSSVMTPVSGGSLNINFTSDPRVRYDRLTRRWVLIIIDVPSQNDIGDTPNRLLIAVSDAASNGVISGSTVFTFFFVQQDTVGPVASTGEFLDYPTLGIDEDALYVGGNMFGAVSGSFVNCTGFVIRKSSILGGGPVVTTAFRGILPNGSSDGPFTPQGVDNYATGTNEGYFIGVSNAAFGRLITRRVTNPDATPTISADILTTTASTSFPITVDHLGDTGGTAGNLDALDDRLFAAHIRNGRLWTSHNIAVLPTGVSSGTNAQRRNAVRWYELVVPVGAGAITVNQSGTTFDSAATVAAARQFWIPSVMVSGQGHAAFGFSTAGTPFRADAATNGRLRGDALGTQGAVNIYTASSTAYNPPADPGGPRRWGDYSFTSLDPKDDMTMWTVQQFTSSTNNYGVQVVRLLAPPPATPTTSAPPTVNSGQASVNVTITGTSVAGSEFYDPGADIAGAEPFTHISATVSGGVTVNSITFNTPTQVTLDINTTAASPGPKDVTITNPDGQSATGVGVITVTAPAGGGQLIISEFRLRGPNPNGAENEFIEIYNNTGTAHTVTGVGAGYGVVASDGTLRCTIPNGTVIPARGHFLCTNSVAYSLAGNAAGNATYTTDIPDNAGIALFNTTLAAGFILINRFDAVGSTSEANTLYKEGTGYPPINPTFNIDYSFLRDLCGKGGSITTLGPCPTNGLPKDTDNNAADFYFVDTNGTSAGAGQRLGAPGPENLSSPIQRNSSFGFFNLNATVSTSSPPNRVRDFTSDPPNNSTFGTLDIRKRVVNNTGAPVTRLRFRVIDITTFPAPSGFADLRTRTSTLVVVSGINDAATCLASNGVATTPCTVNVQGTTLEQPPSQPNGGAFNSTYSAGTVTLGTPLANGASINVRFLLGIQQTGTFKFFINVEALP
ncbi:MAG: lamin tail domain-containing protein [Rubrivivax sp.]|nr:lamin tail domain-containing protein [Pyrinomonadaceae bacterium]